MMKFIMNQLLLCISALITEFAFLALAFISFSNLNIMIMIVGVLLFVTWLLKGKILPYVNSPYKNNPEAFFHRRSVRIKLSALILYIGVILTQLSIFSTMVSSGFFNIRVPVFGGFILMTIGILFLFNELPNKKSE